VLLAVYGTASTVITILLPLFGNIFDPLFHAGSISDQIARLGVIVGLCTIVLVVGQIVIAVQELRLVRGQGIIMRQQHEESQKRARLILWDRRGQYMGQKDLHRQLGIELTIANEGDRTTEDCKIILMLPPGLLGFSAFNINKDWRTADRKQTIDGVQYTRFEHDIHRLIYPNDTIDLPWYDLQQYAEVNRPLYYRLVFKDGATPNHTEWNELGHAAIK
jgi:hypothetical protein